MPGPRKNLTPLDMKMMGLAFNQGGVINFLGKQPEVTAPVRAQSHADSPPVQLAYITDAEKDLLVKSNIHGSMDGKPNPGPAGLPSLDDFFNIPGGGVSGGSTSNTGGSVGGGGSSGGGTSAEDYGIFGGGQSGQQFGGAGGAGMAVGSDGTVYDQTQYSGPGINFNQSQIAVTDEEQKKLEELAEQKQALVQAGIQQAQEQQDTLLGKTKTGIVEGFDKLKSIFSTNELQQFTPLMLKKIQTELDKFIELGVSNPLKLRTLMMSNIGGALFGKDQTYSDMEGKIVKPEDALNEDGSLKEGIRYTREGMEGLIEDRFGDNIFESLKMYAPDIGYTSLGGYMPQTSGELVNLGNKATATKNSDGTYTTADGRIISKEQGEAFNKMVFDARMELDRMNKDRSGNPQGGGQTAGFPGIPGIPSLPIPKPPEEKPTYPIAGQPPLMPGPFPLPGPIPPFRRPAVERPFNRFPYGNKFGIETVFDLGPSFRGSPYTNRGVSPAFYEALRRFS